MPTQGMTMLRAERHQRQEVTRRHFAEEKSRFEGARIAEMDRMNAEFEALSHGLAQLRMKNEELDSETMEKEGLRQILYLLLCSRIEFPTLQDNSLLQKPTDYLPLTLAIAKSTVCASGFGGASW